VHGDVWEGVGRTVLVNRGSLQSILRVAARTVPARLGVTITAIQGGQAGARVAFSDGAERCYELVVGTNGIRSAVRRLAFGQVSPRYVGQMYWRAAAPADLVESLRVVAISWGPRCGGAPPTRQFLGLLAEELPRGGLLLGRNGQRDLGNLWVV
jgi:2-polyprenyl-6-methoxyphenol hydroxylase-like FAD-dependent oxidoreductase